MQTSATFKLILDIRGLCLLVPHGGKMHVLLPQTDAMKHVAWFRFKDGRPKLPFDGVRWDLSTFGGQVDPTLSGAVVDVSKYVRPNGLPKEQLVAGRQTEISSHLILGAGKYTGRGKVAKWKIGRDRNVRMTNKIRWEIENVPADQLNWVFEPLSGRGSTPDPLVHQSGIVTLDLMHAPPKEHDEEDAGKTPDERCTSFSSTHFHMYFPLFGKRTGDEPTCELGAEVEDKSSRDPGFLPPGFRWGPNVFSCMLGQAKVDPNS